MSVSAAVRRAALWPVVNLPDPPAGHPHVIVRRDGFAVGAFPGLSFGSVIAISFEPSGVEAKVEEARDVLRSLGKTQGAWFVVEPTEPAGLAERLRDRGMKPYEDPPLEPRYAAMALVHEPAPGPPEIEARLAASIEEYRAAMAVGDDAFEMSDDDRRAFESRAELLWEFENRTDAVYRTYVALLDGEIVGSAGAIFGEHSLHLSGGGTRADVRGRGAYRALVRARWDSAVAAGTPALTVEAGRHSEPILAKAGFETIARGEVLLDRFAA